MEAKILAKELHKPKRRHFPTRSVVLRGIDETWQADLVDMQHVKHRGYSYLLTVIDVFSKFAFARPLKSKRGEEVTLAFDDILRSSGRKPSKLHTDQGTEFFNRTFKKLMDQYGIHHYHTFSDKKASIVERWNRTLKEKMYRTFTERNSLKWTDFLQELVVKYNNTRHRSIGMKPADVSLKNEDQVWTNLRKKNPKPVFTTNAGKFGVGDVVRVSRVKQTFAKGYTPNWTEELFRIIKVMKTRPRAYKLEDLLGAPIKGSFYAQELQKTEIPKYARIEKIIARKKGGMIRVKWKGYSNRFNQWIRKSDTEKL
jgi:hypothetical protein